MTEREDDPISDSDALFTKLKGWFTTDHEKQADWRKEAREDFGFTSGDQLAEEDKAKLREMNRPIIIMNRIEPIVNSVAGSEVANRQEVQFIPRSEGDVQVNEVLTAAAKWFRDQCDAEDEESDAFRDTVICGMGWTETRLDYEDEPDGAPVVERQDPLEMVWDSTAKKRNLADMRRVFHIRRDIPIDEARALCPGDPDNPFEDGDYDASWVDKGGDKKEPHHEDNKYYDKDSTVNGQSSDKCVTMVRAQWWERVPVYLVLDPTNPDNLLTLDKDEFKELSAKAKIAGGSLRYTQQTRKVFKQAFMGNELLEVGEAPCKDHFSFKCITGQRDRNKNVWYGLVRAMKDPQRWANKWMMQTMHIMNTSAKGGIIAERGKFFDDDVDGEASWAKQEQITWAKSGALTGNAPAFMQKPVSQFPAASFQLMEFAIGSLRDVSGVNVETLGMQTAANQAASLDLQRKQSSMTILQSLFDSLRRYRKEQGRLLLYLIENYLSDNRLIRIVGKEGEKYVPLVKQEGSATYDVIVDESPSSPNQKEATWSMLQQLLPVIGKMLPTDTWIALLKYSPLPTSAQKEIADSIMASKQNAGPDPEAEKFKAEQERENAKTAAEIERKNKMTDAEIANKARVAAADNEIKMRTAQAENIQGMLTAPTIVGPDGAAIQPANDGTALIMSVISEMKRDMQTLGEAITAPKQIIRDPNSGEITAIVPMRN
ncbi:MAG TPA: phage portal protein [Afipia sp.]|nr:phage portal protein [Afipia sp.]HBR46118.1 phage portal protein [Afipia sp.]HCX19045.1 phage portal protein [Afipia sp.]